MVYLIHLLTCKGPIQSSIHFSDLNCTEAAEGANRQTKSPTAKVRFLGKVLISLICLTDCSWVLLLSCLLALSHFLLMLTVRLLTLHCSFYSMTCGFSLEIKTKHQKSLLYTGRFILDFVVDSSANYNTITNEEKDPKGPYLINKCTTKQLSSKLNFHLH